MVVKIMDKELMDLLAEFGDILDAHDTLSTVPNHKKIKEFKDSTESIKQIVKGYTRSSMTGCKPGKNSGSLFLEGRKLTTDEPGMLADIINKSCGGEICPKTNGNTLVEFTFRGLYTAGEDD